jgi:prephenate dehydratase
VLAREQRSSADERTKTSVVFGMKNEPGVLFRALSFFALRNIDLTKLESRPIIGKPWEYIFYLDFQGSILDENCEAACSDVKACANYYRFLGSYLTKGTK